MVRRLHAGCDKLEACKQSLIRCVRQVPDEARAAAITDTEYHHRR